MCTDVPPCILFCTVCIHNAYRFLHNDPKVPTLQSVIGPKAFFQITSIRFFHDFNDLNLNLKISKTLATSNTHCN